MRAAAVGVDEMIGRQLTSQLGILRIREEEGVLADEANPRLQEDGKSTLMEFRRSFYGEKNVFQLGLGDV